MPSSYDATPVAVIGNGPVGQTAALLLARWGIRVLLLDQRPRRDAVGSKAICQQRDVLDIWMSVGAGRIAHEGLTWTTSRTFHRDHELFAWSFMDTGRSPLPPFVNLSQGRTEAILDECIAAQPLIDVRWNHEVVDIEQDSTGVTLTCTTGTVRAAYAIACTGSRSEAIRSLLGVTFDGQSFDDRFLICDIKADLPGWETERRFYFDPAWNPDRQVLIHPCPDSTYRIDWQVPDDFDLDAEQAAGRLDARIRQIIGDRPYEIVWKSVYRFHSRCADRMRAGRVLLAGDCAHLVSPFGARGLNSGASDAENAAWKIAFVLHGWAPETLLDSYHDERHAAALENIDVTGTTMRFLVPQDETQWRSRRRMLEAAATEPELQSKIDSGRFAEPFWYPGSPLTTPDPVRPFAGRPPRGQTPSPGPGILIPDARISPAGRLRELVRDGLLILTTESVDRAAVATAVEEITEAPQRVISLADIDLDPAVLGAKDGEVWLIRPDGYVAAVLLSPAPQAIAAAVRRSLGFPQVASVDRVA
ncbi:2-polyprenyl-6-methoxyphenol hydroxylase-like FAD-dependent oxidoreductase [Kibdelosporangium banguiense]|uniref:2-polyprenyl-6-methoxyphenol hydroxylase-like FAD-dependent oxidoreductase n=1 Tax=Kibdelosporangium banguiense TaxID=1365924 RepID=A0ABS4TKK9_9PSEU|nr:FAD-dependent monooxygenase [Kibdelosporangium banguiense]MBP2324945.1 2-polyprenyl-6-methoxyphenol hydroxylase-like FAD-dependent oxidoreductase [Kibdelosporangium banguiense]